MKKQWEFPTMMSTANRPNFDYFSIIETHVFFGGSPFLRKPQVNKQRFNILVDCQVGLSNHISRADQAWMLPGIITGLILSSVSYHHSPGSINCNFLG